MKLYDYLTTDERKEFLKFLLKLGKTLENMEKKLDKLDKKTYQEIDLIAYRIITEFYEDFPRGSKSYDPTGSLYEMYKIYLQDQDDKWKIEYSPDFTTKKHRVSNDYIFENSFVQGYHGGANNAINFKGEPHPEPGIPYYKVPPDFTSWLRPASQSKSPMMLINMAIENPIKKYDQEIISLRKKIAKIKNKYLNWVILMKSRM